MKPKIRQTFHVSNMIEQLVIYSDMLDNGHECTDEILEKSTQIGLLLMAGYSQDYFLREEINFINKFMHKLGKYASGNGEYNEF